MERKGTVTPLSSVFPVEEAQKASMRVLNAIAERQQQLDQVKGFITDNANLINLVQRLPDELHHDIMVPFGKAAFFPGQLIHTNEFMVLLGEGYYAERTAKQTTEILKRRGKALDTQVESVKAIIQDLKAEASFFDATASEASEGLVEIREDYVEEGSSSPLAETGYRDSNSSNSLNVSDQKSAAEEEYDRIFSLLDELEKEEEAEMANESDQDEEIQDELVKSISQASIQCSEVETTEVQVVSRSEPQPQRRVSCSKPNSDKMNEDSDLPEVNNEVQSPVTASNMAFTGSIVEHARNLVPNVKEHQATARSSKPVSRFKMQRK